MKLRILLLCPVLLTAWRPARAEQRLSLADAIAQARAHRSETAQASIDVERTELNVLRARLERIHLTVQVNASEQLQDLNHQLTGQMVDFCSSGFAGTACNTTDHGLRGTADLTIPVWSGFTVEADIERARWLARAQNAQARATARTIALDVAHAYWAVRRAELLRDVQAEAVRRDQEIEKIIEARVHAGIAPQVDLNRARGSTLREQGTLLGLDGQVAEARAQLAAVLQIEGDIVLTEDPKAHVPVVPPLQLAVDAARSQRPELVAAQAQVIAQAEAVRSARGGYWPQLALFGHADIANANFALAAVPQEELFANFTGGVRLSWTIFDTLTTWAQVRDADYLRSRAEEDRLRARFQVDADVKASHARVEKALAQRGTLEESERVARDNLDIIRRRYEAGDALVIELLDAQVQLLRAESDLVDNAVSIAQAEAELDAALGKL